MHNNNNSCYYLDFEKEKSNLFALLVNHLMFRARCRGFYCKMSGALVKGFYCEMYLVQDLGLYCEMSSTLSMSFYCEMSYFENQPCTEFKSFLLIIMSLIPAENQK